MPVFGDITLPELGINQADQTILTDSVSVVFHSAATVKFDEALKLAVGMNILGTKRVVQLCHKMLKLEVSSYSVSCAGIYEDSAKETQFCHNRLDKSIQNW
jgi:thioester reductase-like protein